PNPRLGPRVPRDRRRRFARRMLGALRGRALAPRARGARGGAPRGPRRGGGPPPRDDAERTRAVPRGARATGGSTAVTRCGSIERREGSDMADLWRVTYMGEGVKPTEVGAFAR